MTLILIRIEAKSIDCCIPGSAGGTIAFADFYALMPPDNAARNASALFITPLVGGTRPVSAHLIITQIE